MTGVMMQTIRPLGVSAMAIAALVSQTGCATDELHAGDDASLATGPNEEKLFGPVNPTTCWNRQETGQVEVTFSVQWKQGISEGVQCHFNIYSRYDLFGGKYFTKRGTLDWAGGKAGDTTSGLSWGSFLKLPLNDVCIELEPACVDWPGISITNVTIK